MRIRKKALLLLCFSFALNGCTESNSQLKHKYARQIDELNSFFNAQKQEFSISEQVNYESQALMKIYGDEEQIILNPKGIPYVSEGYTPDCSFIYGDGFKVRTPSNNSILFDSDYYFDFGKNMRIIGNQSSESILVFDLNYRNLYESIFDYGVTNEVLELLKSYGVDLEKLRFRVEFDANKVTKMSMIFDSLFHKINENIKLFRINFYVKGYNDSLIKRDPFDYDSFLNVNVDVFNMIIDDIDVYLQDGSGFAFEAYPFGYFAKELPADLCMGYVYLPHHKEYNIYIYSNDVVLNPNTGSCYFDFYSKKFYFNVRVLDVSNAKLISKTSPGLDIQYASSATVDYKSDMVIAISHSIENNEDKSLARFISTDSFEVVKSINIEGYVTKTICCKDVYHIVSRIEYSNQEDGSIERKIIVVDKESLEVIDEITCDMAITQTVVDKRGNVVILSNNSDSQCALYLFDVSKRTLEIIEENINPYLYMEYDEETDVVTIFPYRDNGPSYITHQDDEYIYSHPASSIQYSNFPFPRLAHNGFIVTASSIQYYENWDTPPIDVHPEKTCNGFTQYWLTFCDDQYVYVGSNNTYLYGGGINLGRLRYVDGKVEEKYYRIPVNSNFIFGLAKGNYVWLYSCSYGSDLLVVCELPTD